MPTVTFRNALVSELMEGSGNRERLTAFFRSEYGRLVSYAGKLLNHLAEQDPEDFVQDVAVNLFDKADITAPIENLSAYVYTALQNKVIDFFRRRKRIVSLDQPLSDDKELTLAEVVQDTGYGSASDMERMEITEDLYRLLSELKEDERAIIIATEIEDRSFLDLVERFKVPLNTLLSRKSRALKKVKKTYQDMQKQRSEKK